MPESASKITHELAHRVRARTGAKIPCYPALWLFLPISPSGPQPL